MYNDLQTRRYKKSVVYPVFDSKTIHTAMYVSVNYCLTGQALEHPWRYTHAGGTVSYFAGSCN